MVTTSSRTAKVTTAGVFSGIDTIRGQGAVNGLRSAGAGSRGDAFAGSR